MVQSLNKILNRFKGKTVIVWGDVILDEYMYTSTRRISREAPVLITEFESSVYKLGGAGNVVMNIKSLGANPIPVGLIGNDHDGLTIKTILSENLINTDFMIELDDYRTPKKSRILSGGENTKKQQVLRIDTLDRRLLSPVIHNRVEKVLADRLQNADLLLISDYLYRSAQPNILNQVRRKFPDLMVAIDSRNHLIKFKGITLATPNEPELKRIFPDLGFVSEHDYFQAGKTMLTRLKARGIILKRGSKGMIAFPSGENPQTVDIYGVKDIVDETGAGDTVIAVASLATHAGADLVSAARLASIAAGIVVMKEGAYPIQYDELFQALNS